MLNHQYWVLVANSSEAKLYSVNFLGSDLNLIQEFSHPEGRLKGGDLVTDKSGHYDSKSGLSGGSYSEHFEPKQLELGRFAHTLVSRLEEGRVSNNFDKLIVFASPNLLGVLKKDCKQHLKDHVLHFISKDYTKITQPELMARLSELEKY